MAQVPPVATPTEFRRVFTRAGLALLIALLLGETTVNFIDRQVVSVLAPTLRDEFHLSNSAYAAIVNAFLVTYAVSYSFAGWVLDRLGVGRGLTLAISWWSVAGMLTSLSRGPLSGLLPQPACGRRRRRLARLRQGRRHLGASRSPYPRHRHL